MVKTLINEAQFCSSSILCKINEDLFCGGEEGYIFFSEGGGDIKESFGRATFTTKFSMNLFLFATSLP